MVLRRMFCATQRIVGGWEEERMERRAMVMRSPPQQRKRLLKTMKMVRIFLLAMVGVKLVFWGCVV